MEYLEREESELEYHGRVLARAGHRQLPVLERVKFLAIFTTLSDELFRVRIAGMHELSKLEGRDIESGGDLAARLDRLQHRFGELSAEQRRIWNDEVRPDLADAGIDVCMWDELADASRERLASEFEARIKPILTPLAVGPAHPFPFISDLSLSIGALLDDRSESRFGRVKVPPSVDRFRIVGEPGSADDRCVVVPIEEIIGAHLADIFPGRTVEEWATFRVTRNADYTVDEGVENLLDELTAELVDRRFQAAVRLELDPQVSDAMRDRLQRELALDAGACFVQERPLALGDLSELVALDRPELKLPRRSSATPKPFALDPVDDGRSARTRSSKLFDEIERHDLLVQHPYESFAHTTERFIRAAADDESVRAIKQTLYRTSGDSPIVDALMTAVDGGKQVAVLVELKARFDEAANIRWAEQMEARGVHVVYGFVDIKTHTKTALVVRVDERGKIRLYGHIGTGNYNPDTAEHYEDLGLFTADPELTADLAELFNMLTSHSRKGSFRRLLVAPVNLLETVLELIEQQAHPNGRIVLKVNNLTHLGVIDALCDAAQAGCAIDLVVRSSCRLRPGVEGISDNIRVRSIVGPILEHSRIFRFGRPDDPGCRYYIGSADLMNRNLENRVEAVAPIDSPDLQHRLDAILDACLADEELAWRLNADGRWTPVADGTARGGDSDGEPRNVQRELHERRRAAARAR